MPTKPPRAITSSSTPVRVSERPHDRVPLSSTTYASVGSEQKYKFEATKTQILKQRLEYLARSLLRFLHPLAWQLCFGLVAGIFHFHSSVDSKLEDFVNALLFFGRALHVLGVHSSCDSLALFWCYWG